MNAEIEKTVEEFERESPKRDPRSERLSKTVDFYLNLDVRCLVRDGKLYSYARGWVTGPDGSTPYRPSSLYLDVEAKSYVLVRNIGVHYLVATLVDTLEDDEPVPITRARLRSFGPDGEINEEVSCA